MSTPVAIQIGTDKQLFLDNRWFCSQSGMRLTVNPPRKCGRALHPGTPREGFGTHAYNFVVEHDGMYKIFYDAFAVNVPEGQPARSTCYATSSDGIHWENPNVGPYVWNGIGENNLVLPGCTGGVMVDANGPDEQRSKALCIVDEIWQYHAGTHYTHGAYDVDNVEDASGGPCRLVERLDGFISADAEYQGAEFTTPVLTFSGAQPKLDADCSALGEIWLEIRDEQDRPIPGYTLTESISVDRNHIAAPVLWKEHAGTGELGVCKLYAFQFEDRE